MLGLMENKLESKNNPWGYELCFNDNCQQRQRSLLPLTLISHNLWRYPFITRDKRLIYPKFRRFVALRLAKFAFYSYLCIV